MTKRLFALLLCLALSLTALAGCGGGGNDEGGSQPAAATPAPTATPEPYDPNPLTGEAKGSDYVAVRPVAIMINNIAQARPQRGINDADVLYEIMVEGGITRFMGLFNNYEALGDVGPVRSARDQFFRLVMPFQPLYVHIGRSGITQQYIDDVEYGDLNLDGNGFDDLIYRDQGRLNQGYSYEHTAFTTGERLKSYVDWKDVDMSRDLSSPIFDFVDYREPARSLSGEDALSVGIVHSNSYRTYFDWDAAAGKYLMSQYSYAARDILPSTDANNGTQLSFDNVIVLFTDFDVYPDPGGSGYDLQKVDYTFGGVGYYFNGGKAEPIRWKKGSPLEALYLVDTEGNETSVKVNPGKTYLAVVDLEEAGKFSYDAGAAATDTAEVPTGDNSTLENFEETDG